MKKNFLVVALSAVVLMVGAQSAAAIAGMKPMVESTATATPLPVASFPWQGSAGAPTCAAPVSGDVRVSSDVRPSLDIRSGDVRYPGCGFGHGRKHGHGHKLVSGDVRGSFDARGSFDVRQDNDADDQGENEQSTDVRHGGHMRMMPPVFTGDARASLDVRPGMGFGGGHGRGHGNGRGDDQGNGAFVPPAPAPTASASATPVTGAAFGGNQQGQFGGRQNSRGHGGSGRGNH